MHANFGIGTLDADAVILDLEDAVAAAEKRAARDAIETAGGLDPDQGVAALRTRERR